MGWRKLKLFDKLIILSTAFTAVFLIGFWWSTKRPDRDYYLPENFEGWLTIVHSYPGAPDLEKKDGVLQVRADTAPEGIVYTSHPLEQGWGRNRFFYETPSGPEEIPLKEKIDGELYTHIHRNEYYHFNHQDLLTALPVGADTILWDGTRIIRHAADDVVYNKGVKTVEFFYISRDPKPVTFNPPPNPHDLSDKPFFEDYFQ